MKTKLKEAVKEAMKAKDSVRLNTIRGILSEMQYEEMQKNVEELPAESITAVIQRELKKRHESMEYAEKGNRADDIAQLKREIEVIESFLPKQLSASELEKILANLKASTPDLNVGSAMKALKENYSGQFDGKVASEVVRRILAS